MTIVVGVSSIFDAVVVADCRLSYGMATGEMIRRDVCQKLVVANGWSVVGLAGHLCLARHLLNGTVNRLRETPPEDPAWLKDDDLLTAFFAEGRRNHARFGPRHRACQDQKARLLIAWMDYSRSVWEPAPGSADGPLVPGAEVVVVRSPELDVKRTRLGLDVIGLPVIAPKMRDEAFAMLLQFGHEGQHGEAHRGLMAAQVVRRLLADRGGAPAVGGLFQVATVSAKGVGVVPYFYLAPVEPGYGTYVAMRMERGAWVQEHRPTSTVVPVTPPAEIDPFAPPGGHAMFDPALTLNRNSPGVVPREGCEVAWSLYDPDNVHPDVATSWGDEPLAPVTWSAR